MWLTFKRKILQCIHISKFKCNIQSSKSHIFYIPSYVHLAAELVTSTPKG